MRRSFFSYGGCDGRTRLAAAVGVFGVENGGETEQKGSVAGEGRELRAGGGDG